MLYFNYQQCHRVSMIYDFTSYILLHVIFIWCREFKYCINSLIKSIFLDTLIQTWTVNFSGQNLANPNDYTDIINFCPLKIWRTHPKREENNNQATKHQQPKHQQPRQTTTTHNDKDNTHTVLTKPTSTSKMNSQSICTMSNNNNK